MTPSLCTDSVLRLFLFDRILNRVDPSNCPVAFIGTWNCIFFFPGQIMTIETDIIQPVKDFIRDNKFLVNKCTKPDKKGTVFVLE